MPEQEQQQEGALVEYKCRTCPKVFRFVARGAEKTLEVEKEYKYFECERRLHEAWHKLLKYAGLPDRPQP